MDAMIKVAELAAELGTTAEMLGEFAPHELITSEPTGNTVREYVGIEDADEIREAWKLGEDTALREQLDAIVDSAERRPTHRPGSHHEARVRTAQWLITARRVSTAAEAWSKAGLCEFAPDGTPQVFPYNEKSTLAIVHGHRSWPATPAQVELADTVQEHRAAYKAGHTSSCCGFLYRGLCH